MSVPVLVVEDRKSLAAMLVETLRRERYEVEVVHRGDEAVRAVATRGPYLAVITDLKLPGADGLKVLAAARAVDPQLPVFLITAYATVETAIAAIKAGARDYFTKPLDIDRVLAALAAAALPRQGLLAPAMATFVDELVGSSPAFLAALTALRRVAPTDVAVLLAGPSGSGKELFARALHQLSPRRAGPFVPFNCAAVPDTLVEAELFGYERGAFTGATARHAGRFEQSGGGTLFLDEVGEVPPATQVKLLRALEDHRIARLGGDGEITVDVRVVAATNRDLADALATGAFRRDLYHRLHVFPITLPGLAERREDIPALAMHLVTRAAARHGMAHPTLRPAALATLVLHDWPGNVRELANTLERVVILAEGGIVGIGQLGVDAEACRSSLRDPAARSLAARLAADEAGELARFLSVPPATLTS